MNTTATTAENTRAADARAECPAWLAVYRRLTQTLRTAEPYGQSALLLGLRVLYGGLFAQAGWGKLTNLERTAGFFESLALPTPALTAALVASTELLGGVLMVLGVGTRFASFALAIVMVTALGTAHADQALQSILAFTEQAPYPFLVATLIVVAFGAGRFSVDAWWRGRALQRAEKR